VFEAGDEVLADGADDPVASGDQPSVVDPVLDGERLQ
jgi:hypothetical protein